MRVTAKKLSLLFLFLLLFTFSLVGQRAFAADDNFELVVNPPSISITLARTQSSKQVMKVTNQGATKVSILMTGRDFDESCTASNCFDSWVDMAPASFDLEPGQSQFVTVSISVPSDAEFGNRIGFVDAVASPTKLTDEYWHTVKQGSSVGTMFIVKVPGIVKEELSLNSFTADINSNPRTFTMDVTSKSNVHVDVSGDVVIREKTTGAVYKVPIEIKSLAPGENRLVSLVWENAPLWGRFEATLNAHYGDSGKKLTAIIEFSTVPTSFYIGAVVFFLVLVIVSFVSYKKIHKHYGV